MYIPEIKEEINENDKMLVVGEDGKVHIVDVPENGASVWEDIKNKPFGEEEILVTIVPETTIENAEKCTNDVFSPADLIYGETYIVTWDGVEYECVCTSYSGNGVGSTSVLNTVIESYEYPFWIFYNGMVAVVETGKTHTFSISKPSTAIRTLDHKYIKDMYGTEIVETVLIPEQEVVVEENWAYFSGEFSSYSHIGKSINVIFDGVEYVTEPIYMDGDAVYHCKFTTNNGLILDIVDSYYIDIDEPNGYTHTIKAYVMEEHVKQIDNKYIKDMYGEEVAEIVLVSEQETIVEYGTGHFTTTDEQYELISNMWNKGTEVTVVLDGVAYTGTIFIDSDACYRVDFTVNSGETICIFDCSYFTADYSFNGNHTIKIYIVGNQITKIDEKFIPDTIARTNDIPQKTSDLSNDAGFLTSLPDHTHGYDDLPFGDRIVPRTIIENISVNVTYSNYANQSVNLNIENENQKLVSGRTYIVTWQGSTYTCVAYDVGEHVAIGNISKTGGLFPDDENCPVSNEPFCIVSYGTQLGYDVSANRYGNYVVSITELQDTIIEIDEKYIPNTIARKVDLQNLSWNDLKDMPFYEEDKTTFILEEQTLSGFSVDDYYHDSHLGGLSIKLSSALQNGAEYGVIWNGVEYKTEVKQIEGGYTLGQDYYSHNWSKTDVPFGILLNNDRDTVCGLVSKAGDTTNTFAIYEGGIYIHTLDAKYLPENDGYKTIKKMVKSEVTLTKTEVDHVKYFHGYLDSAEGLELGKLYHIMLNGEQYESICFNLFDNPTLNRQYYYDGVIVTYDVDTNQYYIKYYRSDYETMNDSITVNFEVAEIESNELLLFLYESSVFSYKDENGEWKYPKPDGAAFSNMSYFEIKKKRPVRGREIFNFTSTIINSISYSPTMIDLVVFDNISSYKNYSIKEGGIDVYYNYN